MKSGFELAVSFSTLWGKVSKKEEENQISKDTSAKESLEGVKNILYVSCQ
jgi:hypothetical protein